MNKVIIRGYTTRDVEVKTTEKFTVANGTLGVNGYDGKSHFIDFTVWGKQADLFKEIVGKGSNIIIEGEITTNTYENEHGKQSKTLVNVQKIDFVATKKVGATDTSQTMHHQAIIK